jgi:RNA polymerase sigma-70 factor, ECF subfamily
MSTETQIDVARTASRAGTISVERNARPGLATHINKQSAKDAAVDSASAGGLARPKSDLIERIVNRESAALEELFDRMSGRVFGLAYRILSDGPAAEDVVQDAFIWIWDNPQKLDSTRGTLDGLLLTITHRRAIDALRSRTRRSAIPTYPLALDINNELGDLVDEVQGNLDAEAIRSAIATLPTEQLEIIELAYFGGMTHREIAAHTDLPLGTVKSRLRLAMGGLRKVFGLHESGGAS